MSSCRLCVVWKKECGFSSSFYHHFSSCPIIEAFIKKEVILLLFFWIVKEQRGYKETNSWVQKSNPRKSNTNNYHTPQHTTHNPKTHSHNLLRFNNGPNSDDTISVTREQGLTISRPSQRDTLRNGSLFTDFREFRSYFINNTLAFQIPNFNTRSSSSTQPVTVRGETQGVDNVSGFQGVQVFAVD